MPDAASSLESGVRIGPVASSAQTAALRVLFQNLQAGEREQAVLAAQHLLATGELQSDGVIVARRKDRVLGAMLAALAPGAVGLVWPPQAVDGDQAVEDALVAEVRAWLRTQGVRTAQALLRPEESQADGEKLARNGYPQITTLWFMRHSLRLAAADLLEPVGLTFEPYQTRRTLFEETLLATYRGTLDCPELNGVRPLEDVLAGHRAQGRFDPARWWLACEGDDPAGVLLTNASFEGDSWELVYMGVTPGHRRRGLGRQLVRKALFEALCAGASELTLSVDERNSFARRLYESVGFEAFDRRDVFLAGLADTARPSADAPPTDA